jgi:phage tail protein X
MTALETLENELSKLLETTYPGFLGFPPDMASFSQAWANAYSIFAQLGVCGVLPMNPGFAALAQANMAALLLTFPNFSVGTPTTAADIMTTAIEAFWNTPLLFGPTAVYVPLSVKVVMNPLLETEFAILSPDAHAKVVSLAASCFYVGSQAAAFVIAATPPPVLVVWV